MVGVFRSLYSHRHLDLFYVHPSERRVISIPFPIYLGTWVPFAEMVIRSTSRIMTYQYIQWAMPKPKLKMRSRNRTAIPAPGRFVADSPGRVLY